MAVRLTDHLYSGKVCIRYSNGCSVNITFDDCTSSYHWNTRLFHYLDPHCFELHLMFLIKFELVLQVRVEAFCWGAGTALGELPPYFVARAHRLSGYDPDEEEDEFEELQEKMAHPENLVRSG